ncbi:MAG: hypothetical protein DRQ48_10830 [Gammaproteobacteria bacterium]|nr:MAG: hypothetical protein DRQ48_10830 [Gammaproteobacteria bacterium]
MPESVRGDSLGGQICIGLGSGRMSAFENMSHTMTRQALSPGVDEDPCLGVGGQTTLVEKSFELLGRIFGKRHNTLLFPLATKQYLLRPLEMEVRCIDIAAFRNAGAGSPKKEN